MRNAIWFDKIFEGLYEQCIYNSYCNVFFSSIFFMVFFILPIGHFLAQVLAIAIYQNCKGLL